jgi:hypothetical protein
MHFNAHMGTLATLAFQGGIIFRTFVLDSGFGTYAMLTAMVILP